MADLTKEQMVEFITREVMKMLGMDEEEPEDKSCCPDALVIGEADKLPPAVRRQYQLKSLDTYKGDITPYEKIFITGITRMELADIALDGDFSVRRGPDPPQARGAGQPGFLPAAGGLRKNAAELRNQAGAGNHGDRQV